MAITRHKHKDNEWYVSARVGSDNLRRGTYKLHINVDFDLLPHYRARLDACLDNALIRNVVTKYKYINYHDNYAHYRLAIQGANDPVKAEQMARLQSSKNPHDIEKYQSLLKEKANFEIIAKADRRYIYAIPYTIYLPDVIESNNFSKIAALCQEIEDLLKSVPGGSESDLCVSDIPLTPHVWFRQAYVNKTYVNSFHAELALQAKTEGEKSDHYNRLKTALHLSNGKDEVATETVLIPVDKKVPVAEKVSVVKNMPAAEKVSAVENMPVAEKAPAIEMMPVKGNPTVVSKAPDNTAAPKSLSYSANQRLFRAAQDSRTSVSNSAPDTDLWHYLSQDLTAMMPILPMFPRSY